MLERHSPAHAMVLIALLCIALYAPFLGNKLVNWDDMILITTNPVVQQFDIVRGFSTFDPELYIPATLLSYEIEHALFGNAPWIFHLTNLTLHILNAVLVFRIIALLSRNRAVGLLTALLFALHPINTEAVVWASARKDLLSAFFFLLTVFLYLKENRWSIGAFFLGLLAKVTIAPLPLVLLLIDVWEDRTVDRKNLRSKWQYFLLSVAFGIIALFGKSNTISVLAMADYPLLSAKNLLFTLEKIFMPIGLSAIYPQLTAIRIGAPEFFVPLLAFAAGATALVLLRKRFPIAAWCGAWFLLLFAPCFLTFSKNGYVFFASDRYAYLAGIGVFFFVGIALASVASRGQALSLAARGFGIVLLAVCFLLSRQQAGYWANSGTLMQRAIALEYDHPLVENNLGSALLEEGKNNEAFAAFITAGEAGNPQAYFNAAELQRAKGDGKQAIHLYQKGMQAARTRKAVGTQDLASHFAIGQMLLDQGNLAAAVKVFQEAAALGDNVVSAHVNLGTVLLQQGNVQSALEHFERATKLNRYSASAFYGLAHANAQLGRRPQAIEALQEAVDIDPKYLDAQQQLDQLRGN